MDGTLLNDNKEITQPNLLAIKRALAEGIKFVLATGRMFEAAVPYAQVLGLDLPLIAYNGALVKECQSQKVLQETFMAEDVTFEILHYCQQKRLHVQAYWGGEVHTDRLNDDSRWYSQIIKKPVLEIGEELFTKKHRVYKLLVMTQPEHLQGVWQEIEERFKGKVELTSSAQNFLEIITPGINKWHAVHFLSKLWRIRKDEIMCVGDGLNDLAMIENAGVGVAVSNSHPLLLQHAKFVVGDNNHAALAQAIQIALDRE